ncbi:MAG: PD40 domain-containing protein [Acidobacteria bacterium]|nr:PD40 domain-containing protein [Acidobacteriota bacterium]
MESVSEKTFFFGDFELSGARRQLLKDGEIVALNARTFDLLLVLVENRGRVLSKDELLEKVWEGQFVEENNLTVQIAGLRRIFGEKKGAYRFIATIPGKGYKFVAEIKRPDEEIVIEKHHFSRILIDEGPDARFDERAAGFFGELATNGSGLEKEARPVAKNSRSVGWKYFLMIFIFGGLLAVVIDGYFWRRVVQSNFDKEDSFANAGLRQLTTNGKVAIAALAPDGKTFAYVVNDSGKRSLWLGFVDGGNHLPLRPASEDGRYYNLAFGPDGSRLYYSYKDDKSPKPALYRMPVSGGVQEKILDDVDNFSLSPDGRQIAFARREGDRDLIFTAGLDGSGRHEIISFPKNEGVVFNTFSWSPDGRRLAFSKLKDAKSLGNDLAIVEIATGNYRLIENEIWRDTAKTVWMKDGSSVIVHAVEHDSWTSVPQFHLFQVAIPSGDTREIVSDLNDYEGALDLSRNSEALLTIVHRQLNNIWIAPAGNPGAAKQITFGSFGKYDGLWGLDFTPGGKIVYTNSDTQSQFISEMNADGSGSRPLTAPGLIDSVLNVSNDGRCIVFQSIRNGGDFNIWRIDADGGNPKQLTFGGKDFMAFVSADNRWVYYKSWENDVGELRRVPIEGGAPEILNDRETSWVSFSPDGQYFAALYKTDKNRLAVFDAASNQLIRQFDLPKDGTLTLGSRWSPDSRGVVFRDSIEGYWRQPIDGGEPRKLEGLPKEKLYNFAWSKDGRQFAFVRGQEIRDIVLIANKK